ncbi:unnamed protein product [Prorocentrum cordatum]|uniref:Spondin-like TSP1 domain-containing protein n=1 Tax=Prorocentrum cordatum TaxID=2364126 RepID=A0ABN9TS73_9DINO|nr:unnamed protein product [Polarella glacialis]CAK0848837.1 unnamed protein product [Polarella glacialis]
MTRAAMTLLLAVTISCALGAATVAADAAPRGQRSRQSTAARGHSHSELNGLEDGHPYRGHSAHGGEAAELHRTKGHAHHAAAGGPADKEKHATAAHARGSPTSAEEGSKAPEWGGDASEASPGAEPEEDAEELDAEAEEPEHADAEDGAEDFDGPVEAHLPRRGRVHLAVDAAGNAAEVRRGGGPVMRRYNHTSGTDFDDLEEDSLVEEDADLRAQARRSGWWSRRRAPPRRRRAPAPVHCAWAAWGAWGTCSATCGEGKQSATRRVATAQLNGGRACTGETAKTQTCQIQKCTTTSTTTTTTTSTSTTTTTKKVVKAGASRPAGGVALALLLALGAAQPLL